MRGRGKDPNANPGVRPVERIELSEKNPKKRIIIAAVLLAVGLLFIGIAVYSWLDDDAGWTEITPSASGESVAQELVFYYELGVSERSPSSERKELTALYSELCTHAYKLFSATQGYDGVHNIYYINHHVGEAVEVEPELYDVFELIEAYDNRFLYAAPFYTEYRNMFLESEDVLAEAFDPYKNEEVASYFESLSTYTGDEAHVKLELLEENKVRLYISDEFRAYAKEQGIDTFIDLYWAKNAFVLDFIADRLTEEGYIYGSISSFDGFMRRMDTRDDPYSYHLYDLQGEDIYAAARIEYTGKSSIVLLRSYRINTRDEIYYTYKDGKTRHAYVDVNDGLCKSSTDNLVSYSYDKGCGEVLLSVMPVYICREFDASGLANALEGGTYSIYFDGTDICYNDADIKFFDVYSNEGKAFLPVLVSNESK